TPSQMPRSKSATARQPLRISADKSFQLSPPLDQAADGTQSNSPPQTPATPPCPLSPVPFFLVLRSARGFPTAPTPPLPRQSALPPKAEPHNRDRHVSAADRPNASAESVSRTTPVRTAAEDARPRSCRDSYHFQPTQH